MKFRFLCLFFILPFLAYGQEQAPSSPYPDLIRTQGGRVIECRFVRIKDNKIDFTPNPSSGISELSLPKDSITLLEPGSASSKRMVRKQTALPYSTAFMEEQQKEVARQKGDSRTEVALSIGPSWMLGPEAGDYQTIDWIDKYLQRAVQVDLRVAHTGQYGIGGYGWFDFRSSGGKLGKIDGSYSYFSLGGGLALHYSLFNKKAYLNYNMGLGIGGVQVNMKSTSTNPTGVAGSGTGLVGQIGAGVHAKIWGPVYLGVEAGIMGGAARVGKTDSNSGVEESLTRTRLQACLSVAL